MVEVIEATFEDGVFRPDKPPSILSHTRVRLVVEPLNQDEQRIRQAAWEAVQKLWQHSSINSQGRHLTREQLHERS